MTTSTHSSGIGSPQMTQCVWIGSSVTTESLETS
jgi:hypothetical protein